MLLRAVVLPRVDPPSALIDRQPAAGRLLHPRWSLLLIVVLPTEKRREEDGTNASDTPASRAVTAASATHPADVCAVMVSQTTNEKGCGVHTNKKQRGSLTQPPSKNTNSLEKSKIPVNKGVPHICRAAFVQQLPRERCGCAVCSQNLQPTKPQPTQHLLSSPHFTSQP